MRGDRVIVAGALAVIVAGSSRQWGFADPP